MILHFFLEGPELKNALSKDPGFYIHNINEKLISEYISSAKPLDLSKDLPRVSVVSVSNLQKKENPTIAYFYGRPKEEFFTKTLTEDDKSILAERIVEFSSSDLFWQAYLNSELYQAGLLMLANAMMVNPPTLTNGKFAVLIDSKDYKQLSTTSETPIPCTTGAHIQTNLDGSLEFHSKCLFSDHELDILHPTESTSKLPSFLAYSKLHIVLVDNPEAKEDDPLEVQKMISITARLDLYVMPGKEDFIKNTYSGFIDQFNSDLIPIDSVPNDPYINFIGLMEVNTAMQYIRNEIYRILQQDDLDLNIRSNQLKNIKDLFCSHNKEVYLDVVAKLIHDELNTILSIKYLSIEQRFEKIAGISSLFCSYHMKEFDSALNLKDLANGNTLLHDAYHISDPRIAHHLLLLGAEINIPNNSGYTFERLWKNPTNATLWSLIPSVKQTRQEINEILRLRNYSYDPLNVDDFELINTPPIIEPDSQAESSEPSPKAESPASVSTSRLDWLKMGSVRQLLTSYRFSQASTENDKEKGKEEEKEDDKLSRPAPRKD